MNFSVAERFLWVALPATLFLSGMGYLGLFELPYLAFGMVGGLLLAAGLPHGATDHLLAQVQAQGSGRTFQWGRFLGTYLGLGIATAGVWLVWPQASLFLFLLYSAYHFGEAHLHYWLPFPGAYWACIGWGGLVLAMLLGFHPSATAAIIAPIFPAEASAGTLAQHVLVGCRWGALVGSAWVFGVGSIAVSRNNLSIRLALLEVFALLVLGVLAATTPLLVSFAVFFGGWHGAKSIMALLVHFRRTVSNRFSVLDFYKAAARFTLAALVGGIGILVLGSVYAEVYSTPLWFFAALSVVTVPHMRMMRLVYTA